MRLHSSISIRNPPRRLEYSAYTAGWRVRPGAVARVNYRHQQRKKIPAKPATLSAGWAEITRANFLHDRCQLLALCKSFNADMKWSTRISFLNTREFVRNSNSNFIRKHRSASLAVYGTRNGLFFILSLFCSCVRRAFCLRCVDTLLSESEGKEKEKTRSFFVERIIRWGVRLKVSWSRTRLGSLGRIILNLAFDTIQFSEHPK